MKKVLSHLIAVSIFVISIPLHATDQAGADRDYRVNYDSHTKTNEPLGYSAGHAAKSTTSMSMLGWGLALAIAIAIIAGVLHQSTASHADSGSS